MAQVDTVKLFEAPRERSTETVETTLAKECCHQLDLLFGKTENFYEPTDIHVSVLWGSKPLTFQVELQSFFGCGVDVADALRGLRDNLRHQNRGGGY